MSLETFKDEWRRWIKGPDYRILVIEGVDELDTHNDNVDIEVHFQDGRCYGGGLFTPENLKWLMDKEDSPGPYFSSPYMLVVRDLRPETIAEAVAGLIRDGTLERVFVRYGDAADDPEQREDPVPQ